MEAMGEGNYDLDVLEVDRSPKMVQVARREASEPSGHIESLKIRKFVYRKNLTNSPKLQGKEKDFEVTLNSLKPKMDAWKNTKAAREKAIKEGKQKPTFLVGDVEDEKCMSDIREHFGGAKVDLIFAIWFLYLVSPPISEGQFDLLYKYKYTAYIAKILLKWSTLLAPDGEIVIQYEDSIVRTSLILPKEVNPTTDKPFRISSPEDIKDCTAELKSIESLVKDQLELDTETLEDPYMSYENR